MSFNNFFYDPFADFDRLFDEAFASRTGAQGAQGANSNSNNQLQRQNGVAQLGPLRPRMDLHENKETNTVTATFELPGLKKEDISIDVHNGRLAVSGESKLASERNEEGYAVRERRYGKFARTLQLPQGIKDNEIKAAMENGVLTVTFPKSTPETAPKKIAIN